MLLNCGAGEDSWESLGLKQIKPVNPKGNQSWIFIERIDAEDKAPILWPLDSKSWLFGKKTLMVGKTEGRRRRRWQRMRWLNGITNLMDLNLSKLRELMTDRRACHASFHGSQRVRHNWVTKLNWLKCTGMSYQGSPHIPLPGSICISGSKIYIFISVNFFIFIWAYSSSDLL